MTQPPDERPPRPDEPEGDAAPENAPTIAWTPPDPEGEKPAEEGSTGSAAIPEDTAAASEAGTPPTPDTPAAPPPPPVEPVEPAPPPAAPGGPIISATPTTPASEWQTPGEPATPGVPPVVPPAGGWEVPAVAAALPQQQGYVIAGVGARIVAWLIDVTLSGLIPAALALAFVDFAGIMREAIRQAQLDPSGQVTGLTYTIPITLDYILATLIGLGIQFLYFVGFWTSRWQATPGMIGLKLRVVDANTGSTLSVVEATKRWIALGWPLALLALVPALQAVQGLLQFGLTVFLFFTTVTNDRKQGLHDKFANSLVIRSVTSGNGATFAGCLVWGVLVILISFIAFTLFFAAVLPDLMDYIRETNPNAI
jgi:uncharacterized RDD family membrane protein YckC